MRQVSATAPVVIVTSSYPRDDGEGPSAAGVFVRDFARTLAARGVPVRVVTQRQGPAAPRADEGVTVTAYAWRDANRPLVELSASRPGDLLRMISLIAGGVRAVRGAAVREPRAARCLCMWAVPAGLVAMRALWRVGVPYDVWCLGSDIWRYGRQPATRWLVRRVLVRAANTFADGYGLAAEVTALAHRPCGFLPSARLLPENVTAAAAAAVPGRANLLYIGRWHPNKGADLLPAMMRELKTLGVDAHLHVFGGGILEADLRRAVAQAGVVEHVSLYGYADAQTAVAWLRACDALIIPSRIESVPVILADAVQSGIPVVAADVGDMGMLVRRHKIGRAVAPESPRALAAGVQAVLAAPRAAFAGGLREAAAVFNVGAAVDAYLAAVRTCPRNPEPQ